MSNDNWITPAWVTDPLGPFELDPCTSQHHPWPIGRINFYPPLYDGLTRRWPEGLVFMNPPYSDVRPWLERLARHNNGFALLNACTATKWCRKLVWERAVGVYFFHKRIKFYDAAGEESKNPRFDNLLAIYGAQNLRRVAAANEDPLYQEHGGGKLIVLQENLLL